VLRTSALEGGGNITPDFRQLPATLVEADRQIVLAREELVLASPTGAAVLDQIPVRRRDVAALHAYVERQRVDPRLAEIASQLASRPFGECTRELAEAVERWCIPYQKRVQLEVHGRDELVPPRLHAVLGGSLSHLVRNAVAHGIEEESRRVGLGKAPMGSVSIRCESRPGGVRITIDDDGAGIDCQRVAGRAGRTNISDEEALELIYADGISTAEQVDALSGRGVGMGAVRADLTAAGYEIRISTQPGKGTRFELLPAASQRASEPPSASALRCR
jgi:two-component system chemotaxis sensor kinase CheA